jgi:uncharacterized protein (TIGR00369 family)
MHSLRFTEIQRESVHRRRGTSPQAGISSPDRTTHRKAAMTPMDPRTLEATFEPVASDYVRRLGLRVVAVRPGEVDLVMPVAAELVHGGGVVCGQALMAAADSAMVIAMIAELGEFRPMTTVQLQTSFLRPIPGDASEIAITARVLRRGKSLAFGEISIAAPGGRLAAQATTTYALL